MYNKYNIKDYLFYKSLQIMTQRTMATEESVIWYSTTSHTNTSSSECQGLDCYSDQVFYSLFWITLFLSAFGTLTNGISIASILMSNLRKNYNCQLIGLLSFSDLLYLCLVLPFQAITFYHRSWVLPDWFCLALAFIRIWLIGVIMSLLSAIALYRFLFVSNPYRIHNNKLFYFMIGTAWLFPFMLTITPVIGIWGSYAYEEKILQCTFNSKVKNRSHYVLVITSGYFVPIIFIIFCYSYIWFTVYLERKRAIKIGTSNWDLRRKELSIRMNIIMLALFFNFLIGTTPFFLVNMIDPGKTLPLAHIVTSCFAWVSYTLNPLIYTILDKNYVNACMSMLYCNFFSDNETVQGTNVSVL